MSDRETFVKIIVTDFYHKNVQNSQTIVHLHFRAVGLKFELLRLVSASDVSLSCHILTEITSNSKTDISSNIFESKMTCSIFWGWAHSFNWIKEVKTFFCFETSCTQINYIYTSKRMAPQFSRSQMAKYFSIRIRKTIIVHAILTISSSTNVVSNQI